jgi:hypothetical protein
MTLAHVEDSSPARRTTTGAVRAADWHVAIAALLVGAGGFLLGLQVDADSKFSGTGLTSLGIGALLALVASLAHRSNSGLPRDGISALAVVAAFLGLAFVVAGALAPGGPWMFFEVFLLFVLVAARRRSTEAGARWIGGSTLVALGLMLLFRLWVSYQGSEHRWQVLSIGIPVISWIPVEFLDPIKSVSLGSFTPHELGFPPAGLSFGLSMTLWAVGFCLAAGGVALAQSAALEHENDRIHDLVQTLPPPLARLVERLLPEEEWQALGLHGLPERRLAKKIEALATERFQRQREIQAMFQASAALALPPAGGFAGEIWRSLAKTGRPERAPEGTPERAPKRADGAEAG